MRQIIHFLLIALTIILESCASGGRAVSSHETHVELSANNYRIVATNISGESTSKGLLGLSYGSGNAANQVTIIPITHGRFLYKNAIKNLWENFESKFGTTTNRTLALVNVRYDSQTMNSFLYTTMKVVIVADVVEFK